VALQEAADIGLANIEAAQDSLSLAQHRYALGKGTVLEVRDAQLALNNARLRQAEAHFDGQIAVAHYHFALGDLLVTYLPAEYR
jgi:outer membrane protein TolC